MDFLVTMTTEVPAGTTPAEVADMRAREAANTRRLAEQGQVRRLWRPPLKPGQWRTIGLFSADGPADLEATLATMPLRVWRTDEVTPLGDHPNDPGRDRVPLAPDNEEFLVTLVVTVPEDAENAAAIFDQEAVRARELAAEGALLRLWSLPGHLRTLGHWQAPDAARMTDILRSLPLATWLTTETVPLTHHPSDPAGQLG